jgi:hypothetical protein
MRFPVPAMGRSDCGTLIQKNASQLSTMELTVKKMVALAPLMVQVLGPSQGIMQAWYGFGIFNFAKVWRRSAATQIL